MRTKLGQRFERLEDRRLLAVVTEVTGGDLVLSGTPDGAVEVVSTGNGTFDVVDAGQVVASVEGVQDDIKIDFTESDGPDSVELKLQDAAIDRVMVNLGNGSNSLILSEGAVGGSVKYFGGAEDDLLEISEDFEVGRGVSAFLRGGDNVVDVEGTIQRSLRVYSGAGNDSVELGEASEVGRGVTLRLGAGDNTTLLGGDVGGSLFYRGGQDDDIVDILATAAIEGRSQVMLGGGDNSMSVDGALGSHLLVRAGAGDDDVLIGESASIDGRLRLRLGAGDNTVEQEEPAPVDPPSTDPILNLATDLSLADLLQGRFEFQGTGRFV